MTLSNNEKPVSKWAAVPFLTYPIFLLVLIITQIQTYDQQLTQIQILIGFLSVIIGFAVTSFCSYKTKNQTPKFNQTTNQVPQEGMMKLRKEVFLPILLFLGSILVFQALYVFTTLGDGDSCNSILSEKMCFENVSGIEDLAFLFLSNGTMALVSFFTVGILYYHGGIIVLKSNTIFSGNNKHTLAEDFLIFSEAVILFFAASSIGSLHQFVLWVVVLMTMDVVWILFNFKETMSEIFHWIHFDLLVLFFLITLSLAVTMGNHTIGRYDYLFVLIVLVSRTILDYKLGWKNFWSKYKGEAAT